MLVNSSNPQSRLALTDVQTAAAAMGQPLDIFAVTTNREISPAFADAARMGADALLISPDRCSPVVRCNWRRWPRAMRCSSSFASAVAMPHEPGLLGGHCGQWMFHAARLLQP